MYMCKVFPSNGKKLKKRKCDLHDTSSASPKAVVLNLGAFDFWGGGNIQGAFLGALKVYGIYLIAETFFFFREHPDFGRKIGKSEMKSKRRPFFLENTLILGEK